MLKEHDSAVAISQETGDLAQHASLTPRLAWMICYNETGSAQEVCRKFGISRKTFYKWLKRYKASNGDSQSLVDQSRRPHTFPRATPESSVMLLKRLKEQTGFGQRRLRAYLKDKYNITISERTIWKILKRMENSEKVIERKPGVSETGDIIYTDAL
jgi:transposase